MIPEGTYRAQRRNTPDAIRLVESGNKGTPGVEIDLRITEEGPQKGAAITDTGWLTDKAWKYAIERLRLLGWTGDDLSEIPDLVARGGLTNEVELVIVHEDYEGRKRPRVKFMNPVGGGRAKTMDRAALKSFAQRWKASVASVPAPDGSAPASSSSTAPPPRDSHPHAPGNSGPPPADGFGDDDIPF